MATKKISELNALTTPESDDILAIVDTSATETKKITYGNISKHIVNVGTEVEEDSRVNFIHSKNFYHCDYVATRNQVTSTYNGSTLTINGTTSGDFFNVAFSEIPKLKLKAGTYTLSVHFDSGTKTGTQSIVLRNYSTTTNIIDTTLVDGYSNSFTLNSDTEVIACLYLRAGSQTLTNFKMNIQIEQGNQATTYEPYNIPNQIVVDNETFTDTIKVSNKVDGKSRVNVLKSKNLLSTSLELGTFTNSGVKDVSTTNYRTANMVKVKPNTTYTTSINGTAQAYAVYFYTIGGTFVSTATTATFTTPANCEYLNFRCFNADFTSDFANLKVQIEEGSTATSYEPYIVPSINVDGEEIYSKGTTIYDGGTTGSDLSSPISFSDSLANYERIEIYYGTSRPYYITTFYSNYGQHQYFEPSLQFYYLNNADSSFYIYITLLTISQSAMELHSSRGSRTVTISSNGTITNTKSTTSSTIKIYKVIGYK